VALKDSGRVYRSAASSGFTVTPPANESWVVRNLFSVPSTNETYLTVTVGGRIVQKLRTKGKAGNVCPWPVVDTASAVELTLGTIFDLCRAIGRPMDIPVGQGEAFNVARYAEAGNIGIVYDAYDADDIKPDAVNGSHNVTSRYLHYLDNNAAVTASPGVMDTSLMWSGGDSWPILSTAAGAGSGREVPPGVEFEILGILAAPCAFGNGTATNLGYTTYLRLLKAGVVLWDPLNSVGLPCVGNVAQVAAAAVYTSISSVVGPHTAGRPQRAFIPPQPTVFKLGDTLSVEFTVAGAGGAGISASLLDCALLLERRPVV